MRAGREAGITSDTLEPLMNFVHYTLEHGGSRGNPKREMGILIQPLMGVYCNKFAGFFVQQQLVISM